MPSILQGGGKAKGATGHETPEDTHHPEHDMDTGETRSTMVSHGDGSHHIEHEDGSTTEHPHIGHALMHLASKHSDGMHHHAHSDGMGGGHTVHTAAHGEGPEHSEEHGPHEHENLESVKHGMDRFFNEEEGEENDEAGKAEGKSGGSDGKDWE